MTQRDQLLCSVAEPKTVPPVYPSPDFDVVLTHAEAARTARLSERTFQRLDEVGEGPPRIQLTGRRIGYWKRDVIAWLQARTAPAKHATAS